MIRKCYITTYRRDEMIDVTPTLHKLVKEAQIKDGIIVVMSLHTTAGITINENADPDVKSDMLRRFEGLYPWEDPKDNHFEGNTAAHLKTSTVGVSQPLIVNNGEIQLGTWQGVYFCEFDGPRKRSFLVKILPG